MAADEYLAFLPLLIYGIALADLLGEWKRLFDIKNIFIPYILFTAFLTEIAIYNVFIYLTLVSQLADFEYYQYLFSLIPPFLFMLTVNIFTPEKKESTKEYFLKNKPLIYILLALFLSSHFLFNFDESTMTITGRLIGVIALVAMGFYKKKWTLYFPIIIWLILLWLRASTTVF